MIDIDSRIPNLALTKIEKYHLDRKDHVMWDPEPLWLSTADKVYVSCVFEKNKAETAKWEGLAEIGGSGYSLTKQLPPEIEAVKPHINLGFTTRGCFRHCPFCIVREKEGKLRVVGDLLDLWDGHSKAITLIDNNILGMPEHFRLICQQAREKKLLVDFNQGLDHRLLNADIVQELQTIRHREYRFSFDSILYLPSVKRALNLLKAGGLNRNFWYVLVGFDSTFSEDMERLEYLKSEGQTVFVQRYSKTRGNLLLGQWANRHGLFKAMTFRQFLELPRYKAYLKKYRNEVEGYLPAQYFS